MSDHSADLREATAHIRELQDTLARVAQERDTERAAHLALVEDLVRRSAADPTPTLLRLAFTDEQIEGLWELTRREFGALGAANSKLALALTAIREELASSGIPRADR
jgi:hypothetical protein